MRSHWGRHGLQLKLELYMHTVILYFITVLYFKRTNKYESKLELMLHNLVFDVCWLAVRNKQ